MQSLSLSHSISVQPTNYYRNASFLQNKKNRLRSIALTLFSSTLTITTALPVYAAIFPVATVQNLSITRNYHQNHNIPQGINVNRLSRISPQRRKHILDGDATGGGHGPGRGIPGKSEFPSRWSDRQVIKYISDIIKDPHSRWIKQPGKPPFRWRIEGTREGVDIRIIVEPQGQGVITAFPTNRPRNR